MNDDQIEQVVQEKGLIAPRVTAEHIRKQVVLESFHVFPGTTTTICLLTLKNGFTVTGESACVSAANFDAELGRGIARSDAINKIWLLEGYLLKHHHDATFIARLAHEVNRAYCRAIGDDSQPVWDDAPDWQKISAVSGVEFHKKNPDATPEASHDAWLKQKINDGWCYGQVKDPEKKEHPCFRPYSELPIEQRVKDYLFKGIVDAVLCR